jgi:hypothetical protein
MGEAIVEARAVERIYDTGRVRVHALSGVDRFAHDIDAIARDWAPGTPEEKLDQLWTQLEADAAHIGDHR